MLIYNPKTGQLRDPAVEFQRALKNAWPTAQLQQLFPVTPIVKSVLTTVPLTQL
jgi:hypothetical protein